MSVECPVCHEGFENDQGRGGHLASLKDAAHEAYRTLGTLPTEGARVPSNEVLASLPIEGQDPAQNPEPLSTLTEPSPPSITGETKGAAPLVSQEKPAEADVQLVAFEPPPTIEPLKPNPPQGATQPLGDPRPSAAVPFEPLVAGTTALALNAFLLNESTDERVDVEEVRATGFSQCAEACLKQYFPAVATDHPVVGLLASSIGLGLLVASKKGKRKKPASAPSAEPSPPSTAPSQPSPEPSHQPSTMNGSTGDAYWDAVLRGAGGVRLDE